MSKKRVAYFSWTIYLPQLVFLWLWFFRNPSDRKTRLCLQSFSAIMNQQRYKYIQLLLITGLRLRRGPIPFFYIMSCVFYWFFVCLFVFGFYSEVSKCDIMIHLFFCDVATVIPGQLLHHKLVIFYFTQTQYSPILRRHQLYNFTLQQIHSSVLIPTKTVTVLHCSDNKQQLFTRLNQSAREKSIKTLITLFMFINRSICLTAQITN